MLRYEPKDFRPQRWNPDTRRWSFGGFGPLLYRLPEVVAAISAGEPIYLVEGEKDTNTAFRCGVVATTNASGGGNGKFLPEHAEQLRGAHVVLVADRDKAGYQHVIEAQERLQGIAASIRIVQAVEGKDLTDHTSAGHDIEELTPIDPVAKLAELAPDPPPENDENRARIRSSWSQGSTWIGTAAARGWRRFPRRSIRSQPSTPVSAPVG